MRRQFIAMESHNRSYGEISLEDEEVMMDEAAQAEAAVPVHLAEADRLEDIADAMEDLAVIADGIEEASPEEVALVRTVADMAVAGTDVQSEEVIPTEVVPLEVKVSGEAGTSTEEGGSTAAIAAESYVGRRIATETIRETARNIWESIKRFLKEIWEKIEKFFYNIIGEIPRLRRGIEGLKKRIEAVSDEGKRPGKDKVTINTGVAALSVNYKPCDTEGALSKALDDLISQSKWIYGGYVDSLVSRGEKIANAIKDFDVDAPDKALKAMDTAIYGGGKSSSLASGGGFTKGGGNRYPDYECSVTGDLLGNVLLLARWKKSSENGTLGDLDAARTDRIELTSSSEKTKEGPKDFTITPFSTSGMESLLDKCGKLIDTLEEFKRGSKFTKITKARKDIEAASNKAESEVSKLKSSDTAKEREVVPKYRALLNFNKAYASWASSPTMSFYRHAITSIHAVNSIVSKSLGGYKAAND